MTLALNLVNQGRKPCAMPSATQSRVSSADCTESFQRFLSSMPTLKMPTMAFCPCGAIFLGILSVGPGRHQAGSALAIGEECRRQFSDGFHVEGLRAPPPALAM